MVPTFLHVSPEQVCGETVTVSGAEFHHLIRVRRLPAGAPLRVALPDGRVCTGAIASIGADAFTAVLEKTAPVAGATPLRITLFQAVLKGEKMDLVVQKATELGVTTLVPLITKRSVPRLSGERAAERLARWQRIADSAAAQCERATPPHVEELRAVGEVTTRLPDLTLLLHEREGASLTQAYQSCPDAEAVGLLIGPEGGWDPEERDALLAAGARAVRLGARILRAETAAIVAVALIQYLWGDLGGR